MVKFVLEKQPHEQCEAWGGIEIRKIREKGG